MPIPFLSSIGLNKNEVQDFKVFNLASDPTLTSGGDYGYFWLNTSGTKTLKFWDGASIRSLIDSTTISSSTAGSANDLTGGLAGSLPYQQAAGDTTFLGIGTANQVLAVNGGATAPQWLSQSSLSVGSATNKTGGSVGDILVQSGSGVTGFLNVGTAGQVVTSNGVSPQYVDQSTLSVGSATTAGSVTNSLTAGTYLTSGGTYNGSVARTFAVDATDANTASKVVARDASGNFAAGTITAAKVTGLSAPTAGSDAANRDYVDGVAQGLDVKASCLVATTANITLASPGAITIDGVSSATDFTAGTTRILVKDQSAPAENGIYIWQGPSSAMTRSADANTWDELVGAFTFVERGTANADSGWVCTVNAGGTLGTTAVTFVKFSQAGSYTAGNGIVQSGTSFNFAQSSAYTAGQIPFASSTTAMGFNANLHWDNANNRLGIGTATPAASLQVGTRSSSALANNSTIFTAGGASASAGTTVAATFANTVAAAVGNEAQITFTPASNYSATGAIGVAISSIANGESALKFYTYHSSVTGLTERLRIASDGVCTWSNVGGVAGTAMTLNGTGLGVGVSPNTILHVRKDFAGYTTIKAENQHTIAAGTGISFTINDGGTDASWFRRHRDGTGNTDIGYNAALRFRGQVTATERTDMLIDTSGNVGIGTATPGNKLDVVGGITLSGASTGRDLTFSNTGTNGTPRLAAQLTYKSVSYSGAVFLASYITGAFDDSNDLRLYTGGGNERLRIDSSGNLGLGVTPSAWTLPAFQSTYGVYSGTSEFNTSANAYYDGQWKYISNAAATRYSHAAGVHYWFTKSAGTGVIAWTQAMTLDASGFLGIGMTPVAPLSVRNSSGGFLFNFDRTSGAKLRLECDTDAAATGALLYVVNSAASAYQPLRIDASVIRLKPNGVEALTVKTNGQTRFVPLASAPASPESGDVYYDSTTNRLRYYNNTAWVDSGTRKYVVQLSDGSVTVVGNAYTLTHNFGTQDVTVSIRRTTDNAVVQADVVMPAGGNTVTVTFAAAITAAQFYVTVIG